MLRGQKKLTHGVCEVKTNYGGLTMDATHQRLINDAARILGNINQLYVDAAFWNNNTRVELYPDSAPINPDPSGEMAQWKQSLEAMLRLEAARGNFPICQHEPPEE